MIITVFIAPEYSVTIVLRKCMYHNPAAKLLY